MCRARRKKNEKQYQVMGDGRMSSAESNVADNEPTAQLYLKSLSELSISSQSCGGTREIAEYLIRLISRTCEPEQVLLCETSDTDGILNIVAASWTTANQQQRQLNLASYPATIQKLKSKDIIFIQEHDELAKSLFSQLSGGDKLKSGVLLPIQGCDSGWTALAVFYTTNKIISKHTIAFLDAAVNVVIASLQNNSIEHQQQFETNKVNIENAKHDWEASIDSLPHLVIVLNQHAKVNRANKTIESWGLSNVSSAKGMYIEELLKPLGFPIKESQKDHWQSIWNTLKSNMSVSWESQNIINGHALLNSLRTIDGNLKTDSDNNTCYAVLTIEDISEHKAVEHALKEYTYELEQTIGKRTRELEVINKILEFEVQIQKQQKTTLIESEHNLQILARQLINAQELEQKRLSHDLHDSIGQSLGAIKFKVEDLLLHNNTLDQMTNEKLKDIVQMLKNSIEDVRRISMAIRPSMLDDLGIVSTLKWFCREYEQIYTNIEINRKIEINESDIPDAIKVVIYRLIQEAMNNIAKHAGASKVDLVLNKLKNGLYLEISDNGHGFNHQNYTLSESSMRGLGLISMQERAKSTGGSFSIQSSEKGTSIIVEWNFLRV
jgi:signal transduction histidine kinase